MCSHEKCLKCLHPQNIEQLQAYGAWAVLYVVKGSRARRSNNHNYKVVTDATVFEVLMLPVTDTSGSQLIEFADTFHERQHDYHGKLVSRTVDWTFNHNWPHRASPRSEPNKFPSACTTPSPFPKAAGTKTMTLQMWKVHMLRIQKRSKL